MDPEHSRPAAADDLEEEGNVARSDVSITLAEEVIYFMGENKLSSGAHRSSEYENSINCATKNIRVIVVRPLRESSSGYRAVLVTKISPSISCRSDGSSLQSSLFTSRKHRNHTEPGGTMLQRVFAQLLIAVVTLLAIESSAQSPPLTRHVARSYAEWRCASCRPSAGDEVAASGARVAAAQSSGIGKVSGEALRSHEPELSTVSDR